MDPLADTSPARHAYESDDEDEIAEHSTLDSFTRTTSHPSRKVDVKIVVNERPPAYHSRRPEILAENIERSLLIACGAAGAHWAKGAHLGEQSGTIFIEDAEVGMVFQPPWLDGDVVVCEAGAQVPRLAMYAYADAIVKHWGSATSSLRVALLGAYSTVTYIAQRSATGRDKPIRMLGCHSSREPLDMTIFVHQTYCRVWWHLCWLL